MSAWAAISSAAADMKKKSSAAKTALSGVFAAVCVALLFIGSLIDTLDLSAAAAASVAVLAVLIEAGAGYAFGAYAAASVISLLILPQKSAALVFALFAGYYPVLKVFLHKIRPRALSYAARFAVFNAAFCLLLYGFRKVFAAGETVLLPDWVFFAAGNAVFALYDLALEKLSFFYVRNIRDKLFGRRFH